MITIKPVPYADIESFFGPSGETSELVKTPFPFTLYLNGDKNIPCVNFYGHRYVANAVIEAYTEILSYYGLPFIREHGLDSYGGCYNDRPSRGSTRKSVHAWGLAVDVLPDLGPLGIPPMLPVHFVRAFTKRGFLWGGDWTKPDGMHMSSIEE